MSDSESEEELLIYAEIDENIDIESYRSIHVLGVDSKNPIIQMDDGFFTGKLEHPMGTYMFFEENAAPECPDQLFEKLPEKNLKYVCKTRKLLKMKHTYVTPKENTELEVLSKLQKPEDKIKIVNFTSIQEAIEKMKNEWNSTTLDDLNTNTKNIINEITNVNDVNKMDTG